MTDLTPDSVRSILGVPLSDQDVGALIEWYEALGRGLAGFPETDLRNVEPPLRSTPGPGR